MANDEMLSHYAGSLAEVIWQEVASAYREGGGLI